METNRQQDERDEAVIANGERAYARSLGVDHDPECGCDQCTYGHEAVEQAEDY